MSERSVRLFAILVIGISLVLGGLSPTAAARQGETIRANLRSSGVFAKGGAEGPAISGDGPCVAFVSPSTQLVPGITNFAPDVFVHDLHTGRVERVSVSYTGAEANAECANPALSPDGRLVAFESHATNLVPGPDVNFARDIFVRDRQAGTTTIVSVNSAWPGGIPSLTSIHAQYAIADPGALAANIALSNGVWGISN